LARLIIPGSYRETIAGFPAGFNGNKVKRLQALAHRSSVTLPP
jgi:hypothetical protein